LPSTGFIYWKRIRNLAFRSHIFLEKTRLRIPIHCMRVGIGIKKVQLSTLMPILDPDPDPAPSFKSDKKKSENFQSFFLAGQCTLFNHSRQRHRFRSFQHFGQFMEIFWEQYS
jgi:hypothetical protein